MLFEIGFRGEGLLADIAGLLEPDPVLVPHVPSEAGPRRRLEAADLAHRHRLAGIVVPLDVGSQARPPPGGKVALVTTELDELQVHGVYMYLELLAIGDDLPALRALDTVDLAVYGGGTEKVIVMDIMVIIDFLTKCAEVQCLFDGCRLFRLHNKHLMLA